MPLPKDAISLENTPQLPRDAIPLTEGYTAPVEKVGRVDAGGTSMFEGATVPPSRKEFYGELKSWAPTLAGFALTPAGGAVASTIAKRAIPTIGDKALKAAQYAGESLGSLATMGVEKGVSGENPTAEEAGLWAAFPMLGRAAGSLMGALYRGSRHLIPGHGIGEQAYAIREAKKNIGNAVKYGDYESAYSNLRKAWDHGNIEDVVLKATNRGMQSEMDRVRLVVNELRKTGANTLADAIDRMSMTGQVGIDKLQANMQELGRRGRTGSEDVDNMAKYILKLLNQDLETSATMGGVQAQTLREANKEYGRKMTQDRINMLLNKATTAENADPRIAQFRPGVIQNAIKNPDSRKKAKFAQEFTERLTPQEQEYIWQELDRLGKLSPAQSTDPFSWKRRVPAGLAAAALGGTAGSVGGPFGIGAGMVVGVGVEEALANLMKTPSGKRLIKSMIQARGNNRTFGAMGTAAGTAAMRGQE